ncbi:MAG: M48 family metallopeptidase [Clostridia bacterium]|nr:M48 family metallopeptidase [Clostridia bacterium]
MIVPDQIVRTKRKTLAITVDSFGRLIVRAPIKCTEERINAFLQSKASWIEKYKNRARQSGVALPCGSVEGFSFPWLGGEYTVRTSGVSRVAVNQSTGEIKVPNEPFEKQCEKIRAKLKKEIKPYLEERVAYFSALMGVSVRSITVTQTKSRWGSCTAKNAVRFTFRLGYMPISVIDYVIVHELAHVSEKNHGKKFWAIVAKNCPDYQRKRAHLKSHGGYAELF